MSKMYNGIRRSVGKTCNFIIEQIVNTRKSSRKINLTLPGDAWMDD